MEISYTLIVALMYVTILSFGIAGLLTACSDLIRKGNGIMASRVHVLWIIILLLLHFNMTWHAVYLTDVESWTYFGFILIILGPVIGYFTANLLTPTKETDTDVLVERYFGIKSQVLLLFILIQCWTLIADRVLERGFVGSAITNIVLIVVSIPLLTSKNYRIHQIGTGAILVVLIAGIVLRSLQIID